MTGMTMLPLAGSNMPLDTFIAKISGALRRYVSLGTVDEELHGLRPKDKAIQSQKYVTLSGATLI